MSLKIGIMLVYIGLTLLATCVLAQMHPPHPPPPPPPYNMFGSPYMPQPMMPPPPPMANYPASTSVSYSMYPLMPAAAVPYPMAAPYPAAAAPYPSYGPPPPSQHMMYPPPYQTFSGSGPMGDPFTSSTGICKYTTGSRHIPPMPPMFNGYYKRANAGMVCTRYS